MCVCHLLQLFRNLKNKCGHNCIAYKWILSLSLSLSRTKARQDHFGFTCYFLMSNAKQKLLHLFSILVVNSMPHLIRSYIQWPISTDICVQFARNSSPRAAVNFLDFLWKFHISIQFISKQNFSSNRFQIEWIAEKDRIEFGLCLFDVRNSRRSILYLKKAKMFSVFCICVCVWCLKGFWDRFKNNLQHLLTNYKYTIILLVKYRV